MTQRSLIHRFLLLLLVAATLLLTSCSKSWLPTELKLNHAVYQTKVEHFAGPGGINQSFTVYELPPENSATITNKGLAYLNSLPKEKKEASSATGPWWSTFNNWRATPVPIEVAWLRFGRDLGKDWKPSITTFYKSFKGDDGKNGFITSISPEFSDAFHEAISAPASFYAFGDYRGKCLLVVSPKSGKVFYLYRD